MKHSHYKKSVDGLKFVDVYRVLQLFGVTDQALGHAIKKLLVAGGRGVKDIGQDVQEAIDTLERWQEMRRETLPDVAVRNEAPQGMGWEWPDDKDYQWAAMTPNGRWFAFTDKPYLPGDRSMWVTTGHHRLLGLCLPSDDWRDTLTQRGGEA